MEPRLNLLWPLQSQVRADVKRTCAKKTANSNDKGNNYLKKVIILRYRS